jgi:hypothetical protein
MSPPGAGVKHLLTHLSFWLTVDGGWWCDFVEVVGEEAEDLVGGLGPGEWSTSTSAISRPDQPLH